MGRPQKTREEAEASLAEYRSRHRGQTHIRKAFAALGDDVTFSRFVKIKGETPDRRPQQLQMITRHRAFEEGRTFFRNKGVHDPVVMPNVLVSGHANVKIGRDVRKGRLFRGYWIYTLTLEERATCPSSCHHWTTCYGNGMPWAKRASHADPTALMRAIRRDVVKQLAVKGRRGVLVRLHALGDFFSPEYVEFWWELLREHENLAVFGYTARRPWDPIGRVINEVKLELGRRFAIRWSDGQAATDCALPISHEDDKPAGAFVCPEQTGGSQGCGKCGLCWNTDKNVAFIEH